MDNEKRADLFSKFFTKANGLIENKTYQELEQWEEQLEEIVIEAKAYTQASVKKRGAMKASMSQAERDRLITRPDISIQEGILVPKVRKDRQSAADKLVAEMANMNIPAEMINQLMSGITPGKTAVSEQKPKENKIPEPAEKDTTYSFNANKPNGITQELLLDEILGMINLDTTPQKALEERVAAAWLLVPKTKSKIPPDKLIAAQEKLDSLKPKVEEISEMKLPEPQPTQAEQPKPFDFSSIFSKK